MPAVEEVAPVQKKTESGQRADSAPLARGRRGLAVVILLAPTLLVALLAAITVRGTSLEVRHLSEQLRTADANALLQAQQLEDLFLASVNADLFEGTINPRSQEILRTWIKYDKQILRENQETPSTRALRASLQRRVGYAFSYLQQDHEAVNHFGQALELLNELAHDDPTEMAYQDEMVDTLIMLGRSLGGLGNVEAGIAACERGGQILLDVLSRQLSEDELALRLVWLYENLAVLLIQNNQHENAADCLSDSLQLRQQLRVAQPDDISHNKAIVKTCLLLSEIFEKLDRNEETAKVLSAGTSAVEQLLEQFPNDAGLTDTLTELRARQSVKSGKSSPQRSRGEH